MEMIQLTADEKSVLENVYGRQLQGISYNPRKLESIKELTAQEQKFFAGKNFVSSNFFVQTLYKVRGTVNPMKFHIIVNRMFRDNENLRANFCNIGTRTVKVIRPAASVKPEIIFRNITNVRKDELDGEFTKIFEADTRREIDLKHDPLIRFAVYKTSEDEFALMVTMAHLISDTFDVEDLFCNLFDLSAEFKPKKIPDNLPPKNYAAIREYWAKILDNPPQPTMLPYEQKSEGAYKQQGFLNTISADLLSDLLGLAQSNRFMFMAILQSAWGFMLQLINKRRDCLFCQISSAEEFSFNVIPVRLTVDYNLTVEQIVRQQFRQLIVSQPYGLSDWTTLDELAAQKKLFDHFLNFKEFTLNESKYAKYVETPAEPFGKIIYQNSWYAQDMKLTVYFRYSHDKLLIYFLYDTGKFSASGVEKLGKLYLIILQQMVTDWHAKFFEFANNFSERFKIQTEAENISHQDERKKFINFLSQLPILQGRHGGTMKFFENQSKLITLYEGDRISGDMLDENFIFVADGILSRNIDVGDGWYNTLDIIEKNSFVNPTNFLEEKRFKLSATVLTEQADLLLVPHDVMIETVRKHSEVAISVMNYAIEQLERYQLLWMQA